MPGKSGNSRVPATTSRGFSASRRKAIKSLTWPVSTNFSPPYLWKGMLARASSASSIMLWCEARNSTAWRRRSMPASRCSRILRMMYSAWSDSSSQLTSQGRSPSARSDQRFLA